MIVVWARDIFENNQGKINRTFEEELWIVFISTFLCQIYILRKLKANITNILRLLLQS